jgi:hypothetical protein
MPITTSVPTFINNGQHTGPILVIGPVVGTSTNATAVLANSDFDARLWATIGLTLAVATFGVTWTVTGANVADFSDEVVVQVATAVAAGAVGSYSTFFAAFAYYRVKIIDTVANSHGTVILNGIVKAS